MAKIGHQLLIKYGLGSQPPEQMSTRWVSEVRSLIQRGIDPDEAGREVAKRLFPDYNTHHYASEADSIEALLAAAAERAQRGG